MTVRGVAGPGKPPRAPRASSRKPGKVELQARKVLADIDTDHAAADLLSAVATRLAQDIDETAEVRDRVAASRELREVLRELDTAVIPTAGPQPKGGAEDAGDADAADDDPFEIGTVPPVVGDAEVS